jgi:hypothetical protein
MKTVLNQKLQTAAFLSIVLLLISSCAPQIKLTSSWTNKQAKLKKEPVIMVAVLGKPNSTIRKDAENNIVKRLNKDGFKAIPASDLLQPGVSKRDSAEVVNILRKNNIDMLLTSAVINVIENERFIPGAVPGKEAMIPTGGTATPYNAYNSVYVGNSYYNYYNYYGTYQTLDAPKTPGTTVTDVQVIIESNLYEVSTPELIWHGQSKSYTKEFTAGMISTFSKNVIGDIKKNKLLIK